MAGRASAEYPRKAKARTYGVVVGGALSAFVAAAAMATSSAAPAKADFADLVDPIIQPLLTSFTESISASDPAAAVDITNWADSLLASLNSIDAAVPSTTEAAAASSAEPAAAVSGTYILPITVYEGTESTVQASVDGGASVPVLVDSGSSGLVIPWQDLGPGSEFQDLLSLGFPTGFGESGYSGGVEYYYLTYNLPVDYADGLDTTTPVEVEVYSWTPGDFSSLFTNNAFQGFLADNQVNGILGIGDNVSGGAGVSPIEAAGFNSVTVDIPQNELIVSNAGNPFTAIATFTNSGATPITQLYETVTNGGSVSGAKSVYDDLDTGGVFGTIPSSIASGVAPGSLISVYAGENGVLLYQYQVASGEFPTPTSGTTIDSGAEPFLTHPLYINYATDKIAIDAAPVS